MKSVLMMWLLFVVFVAPAQGPASAFADENPAQAPGSESVTIYVGAVSKTGQFVDLHVPDLTVEENDKAVHIDAVTCGKSEPLLIGLLIDISGSRSGDPLLASHYDALKTFLSSTLTPEDGGYIVTFGASPRAFAGVTSNLGELDKALDELKVARPFGPTAMYDAIQGAGNANFFGKQGRRVLIVVGDFEDNVSRNTLAKASLAALSRQTTVYPVVDGADNASYVPWKKNKNKEALQVAKETGGQAFIVKGKEEFASALRGVQTALKSSCRVEYTAVAPTTKRDFVKLTVKAAGEATAIYYPDKRVLAPLASPTR